MLCFTALHCTGYYEVQSSNVNGTDVQTVIEFPSSGTNSVALTGGRIYCRNLYSKKLRSFTTAGQDFGVLHEDINKLNQLAIISRRSDLPRNRTNHCDNQRCENVCVLTLTSFRCVP